MAGAGWAPTTRSRSWPPATSIRVGMLKMLKRLPSVGALSVLTLATFSRPASSTPICSTAGLTIRQGPHQGAQKSTSTGTGLSSTTAWKLCSSASTSQGRGLPQFPHTGTPLASGRTRLAFPQAGQWTIVGSGISLPLPLRLWLDAGHADRAGHAGTPDAAVSARVLVQVLLVIVLGEVELGRVHDLGRDLAVPRRVQRALEGVARALGRSPLL